tara:strand:+ start:186 stop:665 length:480 start_codon:yes stop_codon:yes gene_type:complete
MARYKPEGTNAYQGKQVIIDSDRLLFNAKDDSILLFSNKGIGLSTKGSINFDTSNVKKGERASRFTVNAPHIYLGLKFDKTAPTEPAILGHEFEEWANNVLDCIDGLISDILLKVSYTAPGGLTAPFEGNERMMSLRRRQIKDLRADIKYLMSKNTKLV